MGVKTYSCKLTCSLLLSILFATQKLAEQASVHDTDNMRCDKVAGIIDDLATPLHSARGRQETYFRYWVEGNGVSDTG